MTEPSPSAALTGAIPASSVRVSVRWGERLFVTDVPSGNIAKTLLAFEKSVGPDLALWDSRYTPQGSQGCRAAAAIAVNDQNVQTVTAAALWLFLFEPDAVGAERIASLDEMVERDGGAWLVVTTDPTGSEWGFTLCATDLAGHGDEGVPRPFLNPDDAGFRFQ
jgi:hypothetical protein